MLLLFETLRKADFKAKCYLAETGSCQKITFHCHNRATFGLWPLTLSITVEQKPETCGYHLISFQLSHFSPRKGLLVLFNTTTQGCSGLKTQCSLSGKTQFQASQNDSKTTPTLGKRVSYRANLLTWLSFTSLLEIK